MLPTLLLFELERNHMSSHPIAPKRPFEIIQHGQTRIDDYYWLRYREDPEVMKYLHAESDYLDEVMGHTRSLQETLFNEMKGRIQETDSSVPEKRGGYLYYERMEQGKQYPIFCRRKDTPESAEEILLDQNSLAEGKTFCSVSAFKVSPDGDKLAYSVDVAGNEVYTLRIKDLITGEHFPETIENTFGSVYVHTGVEWADDSQTVFYLTLDSAQRAYKLMRHKVGTAPTRDVLVFHEEDETFSLFIQKTRDNAFVMTNHHSTKTTEMRYLCADKPEGELLIVSPRRDGIEYYAVHHDGTFLISTNENARNFKLVKAKVGSPDHRAWQEVIPHREDVLIDYLDTFENYLVVYERRNGLRQIRISSVDGTSRVNYVKFPEPTYNVDLQENSIFESNTLRFKYSSLVTPPSVIDHHMDTGEWETLKQDQIPSGYDPSEYISERLVAKAGDGTPVPISIVYRKDIKKDGLNPALIYGYGSYGAVIDAEFNPSRLSLLERGFVCAIAHIRGGSDMGRTWYDDGKMLNKKNTFTDLIACAEHLIKEGFTSPDRLAIQGASAGGLLVTSCLTMRPDLFKAVIAKVAFVDVLTTMSDPSIPLTTLEWEEWGNPEIHEQFEYMKTYSPYDNIRQTEYPNLLLTTGLNDPRVAYWEPAKFAAKLRELKTDDNLMLLKTNYDAGHAGSSGRYDFLKEIAFDYAFLLDRLSGDHAGS